MVKNCRSMTLFYIFSALLLLAGPRKDIQPAQNCWYSGGGELTEALHVLHHLLLH